MTTKDLERLEDEFHKARARREVDEDIEAINHDGRYTVVARIEMTTPRQKKARARATRKQAKRVRHAHKMLEHERRRLAAREHVPTVQEAEEARAEHAARINVVLGKLPEGCAFEKLPNGNLQVTATAKRLEADGLRRHLLDIVESTGLTTEESDDVLHEQ